eukprot:scaffold376333_cov39-Prasinocladus_malaysianus.AAC.1
MSPPQRRRSASRQLPGSRQTRRKPPRTNTRTDRRAGPPLEAGLKIRGSPRHALANYHALEWQLVTG